MITSDWPARVEKKGGELNGPNLHVFLFFELCWRLAKESIYKKDGFCVCCLRNMILEVG